MQKQTNTTNKLDTILQFLTGTHEPEYKPKMFHIDIDKDKYSVCTIGDWSNAEVMNKEQYEAWKALQNEKDVFWIYEHLEDRKIVSTEETIGGIKWNETKQYPNKTEVAATNTTKQKEPVKQAKKGFKQRLKDTVASIVDTKEKEAPVIDMKKDEIPYEVRRTRRVRFVDPASFGNDPLRDWLF